MIGFGVLGYLLRKFKFEMAPLVLALVLGPMMEKNLRMALLMSQGDPLTFFKRPLSAVFFGICTVLIFSVLIPGIRKKREKMQEKLGDEEV